MTEDVAKYQFQKKYASPPQNQAQNNGKSPLDELRGLSKTKEITLSTGKVFTIESVLPGHYYELYGSPLLDRLLREETQTQPADSTELSSESIEMMRFMVCQGVVAYKGEKMRFSLKRPSECAEGEITVYILALDELVELTSEIDSLTNPAHEVADGQAFREEEQDGSGETSTSGDSPASKELRKDTV